MCYNNYPGVNMSVIIPYDESLLDGGAFISPSGRIYRVKNDHEAFCEEFLSNLNENFGNDVVKHQKLHKMLDTYYKESPRKSLTDFMVLVLDFDKVEIQLKKTITTSSRQPHIRFYNYYLMDWNINIYEKLYYNTNTNRFDIINPTPLGLDQEDTDEYYEIEDIKSKVLIKERNLFFK